MKKHGILSGIFLLLFAISSSNALAGGKHHSGDPVHTMAKIMMHLNHYPSNGEKKQLESIISHSKSNHIKVIAQSMINLHHKASSADKKKLKGIVNDSSAPQNVRDLAKIIYNLSHSPSSGDKQLLSAM